MKTSLCKFDKSILMPGDFCLYGPKHGLDIFSQLTMRRTAWGYAVHVEIYHGDDKSTASRNGKGVDLYPFRDEQLLAIRRANSNWDYNKAYAWFLTEAKGQKYDWLGLMCFAYAVKKGSPNKMFCSEYATNFARQGGFQLVLPSLDADTVSPNDINRTMSLRDIWRLK